MDYLTIENKSEIEIIIQKSRFIGRAFPVSEEKEAISVLEDIRKKHYDASHNCYAYRIGALGNCARFSDDKEPSGTAGYPMMDTLIKKDVMDLLVVVTRYFGGILLGAGGLVRAYSKAASEAVDAASVMSMKMCTVFSLKIPYDTLPRVENLLIGSVYIKVSSDYGEKVVMEVAVQKGQEQKFLKELSDTSLGSIIPEISREEYRKF